MTSLPEIIHVHEQGVNNPKTPTMIDYKLEESGKWSCTKCNHFNTADDGTCIICNTMNNEKRNIENSDNDFNVNYKDKSEIAKRSHKISPNTNVTKFQYPRIRVEDEEGYSIHSFIGSYRDDESYIDDSDKLEHSLNQRSVTPSIMNDVGKEDFSSTTDLPNGNYSRQNEFDDAKSFNSNFSIMVRFDSSVFRS